MNATDTAAPAQWEEPIRAELFGIECLEQHAESLAAAQRITDEPAKDAGPARRLTGSAGTSNGFQSCRGHQILPMHRP